MARSHASSGLPGSKSSRRGVEVAALAWAALLLLSGAAVRAAAEGEIVTDRPTAAASSATVPRGRLLIEIGLDLENDKEGGTQVSALRTPTKVRYGLLKNLEIHLETGGISHDDVDLSGHGDSKSGISDADLGLKAHLLNGNALVPSTGILLAVTLPVGSQEFTEDEPILVPTVAAEWELPWELGLAANLGMTIPLSGRDERDDVLRYALALSRSWAPEVEWLGSYIEVFGETPFDEGDDSIFLDGGLTYLVNPDMQLDLSVRLGLTDVATDVGGAVGLSIRF